MHDQKYEMTRLVQSLKITSEICHWWRSSDSNQSRSDNSIRNIQFFVVVFFCCTYRLCNIVTSKTVLGIAIIGQKYNCISNKYTASLA